MDDDDTITPLDDQPPSTSHFRGAPGVYVDVVRGADWISAFTGESPEAPGTLEVLGSRGREVDLHEGHGVVFALGAGPCDQYLLAAYGVDRGDLARLAESLEIIDD